MAYTLAKFHCDGTTGKCVIFNVDPSTPGDMTPFTDSASHRGRIHFNSEWSYLEAIYDQTATLSLSTITGVGTALHMSASHGAGTVPHAFMLINGVAVDGDTRVQLVSSSGKYAWRSLGLFVDSSTVAVRETRWGASGLQVPAASFTVRIIVLGTAAASDQTYAVRVDPAAGVVNFGRGKFSVGGNKKVKVTAGTPEFRLPKIGPSIESSGRTLRIVHADGSVEDLFGYSGSFSGSGTTGVVL